MAKSGLEVFLGDILDALFAPTSFDAITCFHAFEHLDRHREVLANVFERLRPGGIFYTMVPNIDSGGSPIFKSYWYALELPGISFVSLRPLRILAQSVSRGSR